jgi:hypothetical protein
VDEASRAPIHSKVEEARRRIDRLYWAAHARTEIKAPELLDYCQSTTVIPLNQPNYQWVRLNKLQYKVEIRLVRTPRLAWGFCCIPVKLRPFRPLNPSKHLNFECSLVSLPIRIRYVLRPSSKRGSGVEAWKLGLQSVHTGYDALRYGAHYYQFREWFARRGPILYCLAPSVVEVPTLILVPVAYG